MKTQEELIWESYTSSKNIKYDDNYIMDTFTKVIPLNYPNRYPYKDVLVFYRQVLINYLMKENPDARFVDIKNTLELLERK